MRLIEFKLVSGRRITINLDRVDSICESPDAPDRTIISTSNKGWNIPQSYDQVVKYILGER